jgi:hypothetical protein
MEVLNGNMGSEIRRYHGRVLQNSACRLLLRVSCWAYFSMRKMEAVLSSETLDALQTTLCCKPEDRALQNKGLHSVESCKLADKQ